MFHYFWVVKKNYYAKHLAHLKKVCLSFGMLNSIGFLFLLIGKNSFQFSICHWKGEKIAQLSINQIGWKAKVNDVQMSAHFCFLIAKLTPSHINFTMSWTVILGIQGTAQPKPPLPLQSLFHVFLPTFRPIVSISWTPLPWSCRNSSSS